MNLDVHPHACANFDQRAAELCEEVRRFPAPRPGRIRRGGFMPDVPIALNIRPEDVVGEVNFVRIDANGDETGRRIPRGPEIRGPVHARFLVLAERVYRQPGVRRRLSSGKIRDLLADWIAARLAGDGAESFVSFLEATADSLVRTQHVSVPISNLRRLRAIP